MYTTVLCFLIAIPIHLFAPVRERAQWTPLSAALILGGLAVVWALCKLRYRSLMVSALVDPARAAHLRPRFTQIMQRDQALLLVPFALYLYLTDYNSLVPHSFDGVSEAASGLLGVAPYLLFWIFLWWEAYPLQSVLAGRGGTRRSFLAAHARMDLPAAAPWAAVLVASDLLGWLFPELTRRAAADPFLQLAYPPLFLLLAAIFMPLLVKSLWGCVPVPQGPLRERLTAVMARTGLKVREILFWPLLEGRVLTAGIVGLLPRYRYLLLTPSLVALLTPEELDGVVAHEAGHARHRHLWFYLLFFGGILVFGLGVFFQLAGAGLAWGEAAYPDLLTGEAARIGLSVALTAGVAGIVLLGLRGIFGAVSRAFERQADLHALETLGDAGTLISAFESLSRHSGDLRDVPSWHHGSLGERIAFLEAAAADPSVGRAHHRKVARLKLASGAFVLSLLAAMAWLHLPQTSVALERASRQSGLERFLSRHPDEPAAWVLLGGLRLDAGDDSGAMAAFRTALTLSPADPEAQNGLAWALVTARDPALRDPGEARRLAARAARAKPEPHILDTLAEAEYLLGDRQTALSLIEEALALTAPGDPEREHYQRQRRKFLTVDPPRML